jgi:hypothetical protein
MNITNVAFADGYLIRLHFPISSDSGFNWLGPVCSFRPGEAKLFIDVVRNISNAEGVDEAPEKA